MIRFAICDDEPYMAREISDHLSEYMEGKGISAYGVSCFSDGRALLESGSDFDVIFLDIQMEKPDGLEVAEILRQQGSRSLLVFVTVLRERVFDAFDVEACGYLLKPLDSGRFGRTMDRVARALERRSEKSIVIRRGASCEVAALREIMYCEVQGRKVYIHQSGGEVIDFYERLDALEKRIDRRFFRCHRSYLVNLEYVRGCQAGRVILAQGSEIPVSRLRERELAQALLRYMKEREL